MKRRNLIIGGGALATTSLAATATNASLSETAKSVTSNFQAVTDSRTIAVRPPDNEQPRETENDETGIRFKTTAEWPKIGAELGDDYEGGFDWYQSDDPHARIYRVGDEDVNVHKWKIMGDRSIYNKTGGDTFILDLDSNLKPDTKYAFVIRNAEGGYYIRGRYEDPSFPYRSTDGKLSIINSALNSATNFDWADNFRRIGEIGFDLSDP